MANPRKRRQPASKTKKAAKPKPARSGAPRDRKPTQQERWDAARREKRRRRLLQQAVAAVTAFVVIAGVVAWQVNNRRNENRAIAAMTRGTCEFDRKSDEGRVNEHAAEVAFGLEPPSGGVHDASAASPGVFRAGESPSDGQLVHAMEHGDIVIWYRALAVKDLASLRSLADSRNGDVFLVERPTLPTLVAATGWHKRLLCEDVEVSALRRFIVRYADKGPERQPE